MQQRIYDSFSKVEARAISQHDYFMLDTIRFFRNANELYRRFNDWKSVDRFYFIPLKLNMTYCIGGHSISMADDPVYLGTFIRNTVEHPDLFVFSCRSVAKGCTLMDSMVLPCLDEWICNQCAIVVGMAMKWYPDGGSEVMR